MQTVAFSYSRAELEALSEAKNYYRSIAGHFAPYVGKRIIEVGAGIGTFSEVLLNGTNGSELFLVEPADNLRSPLQERFSKDMRVTIANGYLEDITTRLAADSVVVVNVLEHVADDQAFLQAAHRLLVPGGAILIFTPALPQLYGTLDQAFGHVQRYSKSSLASKLQRIGFRLLHLRYFNFPGVIAWFLAGKVLRRKLLRPADIRLYDRWVVPWASKLERKWEPPLGQSLIAIASK